MCCAECCDGPIYMMKTRFTNTSQVKPEELKRRPPPRLSSNHTSRLRIDRGVACP